MRSRLADLRRLLRVRMDVDFDHVAAEKGQQDQVGSWPAGPTGKGVPWRWYVPPTDKPANQAASRVLPLPKPGTRRRRQLDCRRPKPGAP